MRRWKVGKIGMLSLGVARSDFLQRMPLGGRIALVHAEHECLDIVEWFRDVSARARVVVLSKIHRYSPRHPLLWLA